MNTNTDTKTLTPVQIMQAAVEGKPTENLMDILAMIDAKGRNLATEERIVYAAVAEVLIHRLGILTQIEAYVDSPDYDDKTMLDLIVMATSN